MTTDRPGAEETSKSLLVRVRDAGDRASWETFVAIYGPLIRSFARLRGLQDADVDDVAQDVLTAVARSMPAFEYAPAKGRFRDWLGAVTRNAIRKFANRRKRAPEAIGEYAGDPVTDATPDPDWTARFHAHVLRIACERIRPGFEDATWRAFSRAWLDDVPAATVADELRIPVHSVYVAKSRVLKRLRDEVTHLAEDSV